VFFAGITANNSMVREHGLAQLQALAAAGVRVDIPDRPLPLEEFYERCARAWLCGRPRASAGTASATTRRRRASRCR